MKIILSTLIAIIASVSICLFLKEDKNIAPSIELHAMKKNNNVEKIKTQDESEIFKTKESLKDIAKDSQLPIKDSVQPKATDTPIALKEIETIHMVQNRTLEDIEIEIEKIPSCIENVETKEEAIACTKTFVLLQSAISLTLELDTNYTMQYQTSEWDNESKSKILDELEVISANNESLKICLNKAQTKRDKKECFPMSEMNN